MFENSQEIIKTFTHGVEDNKKDFLLRENSNFVYSLSLLRHNIDNFEEESYLMENVFTKELKDLYNEKVIYVHDKKLSPYCNSISCLTVATIGVPTISKNMLSSKPTKKIGTFFRQLSNLVTLISQQSSGAIMLSQLTTVLAGYLYYMEKEMNKKISDEELTDLWYNFIWEVNLPLRSGSQSAFSNATMEFGKPSDEIKNEIIIVGGDVMMEEYKNIPPKYFDKINNTFINAMAKGTGTIPFTFPLITVPITDDFDFNNKTFLHLLDQMYKWNGCYFENFRTKPFGDSIYSKINPMIKPRNPEVSRSLCCRLQIDLELLSKVGGGIFGSSSGNTGAVQVLNANMNRLLMEYKYEYNLDWDNFTKRLDYVFEVMEENQQRKREWILNNKELYPTFFAFNKDLKNYFNVFAVSAMHEGLINIGYKDGIYDEEGKKLAHKVMQYIHTIINKFILRDSVACGIEFAPNENCGVAFSRADIKYGERIGIDVFVQGNKDTKETYTTSGCMLPFSEDDFIKQIENASEFQAYATSGSILHQFLEDKLPPEKLAKHIDNIFKKPIIYTTLTPTSTSCMSCGNSIVAKDAKDIHACPICGSDDLATFSRVIGYSKMISRKGIKINEYGKYEGEYNFWSNSRRIDWASRKKINNEVVDEVSEKTNKINS